METKKSIKEICSKKTMREALYTNLRGSCTYDTIFKWVVSLHKQKYILSHIIFPQLKLSIRKKIIIINISYKCKPKNKPQNHIKNNNLDHK